MSQPSPFAALGLPEPLVIVLESLGFAQPTPVQAACIPPLLAGRDVLGEAQTGTGKTGAFGLPLLAQIEPAQTSVQALVLTPTRELANQVAAALTSFAARLTGIDILPIYGGQPMGAQLRRLRAGAQIVVGTPGRVVDHMKRGSLVLDRLRLIVLDEADEMLRMGFIEDIEWILEQTPAQRQTALFSATMPAPIRRIAHRHLREPEEIRMGAGNEAGADIEQVYCLVDPQHKLEALGRLLEVEAELDAAIVFTRTKAATQAIVDGLADRGHRAAALNGDMEQSERERVVADLRAGRLNVIVATDVAARGIDVPRISHVINFDAPGDAEAYVHRIGRTGRAGRKGRAILFVEPRQRRVLRDIEHLTRKPVAPYPVPDLHAVRASRQKRFAGRVESILAAGTEHHEHHALVQTLLDRCQTSELDLASALIALATELTPLRIPGDPERDPLQRHSFERHDFERKNFERQSPGGKGRPARFDRQERFERGPRGRDESRKWGSERSHGQNQPKSAAAFGDITKEGAPSDARSKPFSGSDGTTSGPNQDRREDRRSEHRQNLGSNPRPDHYPDARPDHRPDHRSENRPEDRPEKVRPGYGAENRRERRFEVSPEPLAPVGQVRYYLPLGRMHGVGPREIVGALTHEGGLSGTDIGRIRLFEHYSQVDLPAVLSAGTIQRLGRIHVAQRRLQLSREIPGSEHPMPTGTQRVTRPDDDGQPGRGKGSHTTDPARQPPVGGTAPTTRSEGGEPFPKPPKPASGKHREGKPVADKAASERHAIDKRRSSNKDTPDPQSGRPKFGKPNKPGGGKDKNSRPNTGKPWTKDAKLQRGRPRLGGTLAIRRKQPPG